MYLCSYIQRAPPKISADSFLWKYTSITYFETIKTLSIIISTNSICRMGNDGEHVQCAVSIRSLSVFLLICLIGSRP